MGIRQRRARLHSRTHIVGFGIVGAFGFIALFCAAMAVSLGALVSGWLKELPDYQSADAYLVAEPTQVYAADGTVLTEFYLQERHSVDANEISPYVFTATVDVEDERFYRHNGVDPQGIARAVVAQLMGNSEGASTITQQLVRNTVLSEEQFDRTLRRKVREAYIAIQMEKAYTKDQILLMYVNTIYYGHGAYGIEAAAVKYFNKHASELTLNEAATLVGIPNSPSYYDPTVNMEACRNRRDHVLYRMLQLGDITQEEYDATIAEDIQLNLGSFTQQQSVSPYFTDYIRELLAQDFDTDLVLKGGLRVYTTLDLAWQAAAEAAVTEQLMSIDDDQLQAGLVAIDPSNGHIRAMVGGRDYGISQFNMATQARRQTGSSFKVFTLVAALELGVNPSIYLDCSSPMQITPTWKVQNYGNISYGPLTLAEAMTVSSNTGLAQVAVGIGAENIVTAAHAMGISYELPPYPSITLGTEGIPPIQMAEAYATLATGGVHHNGVAITRIEDRNGNVVYEHEDNPEQAIPEEVAQVATETLERVITSSSGTAHVVSYTKTFDQPIAGKTGTTEDFRDLWFCAYTPQVSVAIWVGNEDDTPVRVDGAFMHPYNTACPIFVKFANVILEGVPREEFPETGRRITYRDNSVWDFSCDEQYWADYYAQQEAEAQAQAEAEAAEQAEQAEQGAAEGTEGQTTEGQATTTEQQPAATPTETTTEAAPTEGGGEAGGE